MRFRNELLERFLMVCEGPPRRSLKTLMHLEQRGCLRIFLVLHQGDHHFNMLMRATELQANTLTIRLKQLISLGLVEREIESMLPPSVRYFLTDKGRELAEIVRQIDVWDLETSESRPIPPETLLPLEEHGLQGS